MRTLLGPSGDDAVAPAGFGLIQRLVRGRHEFTGRSARVGDLGRDAEARRQHRGGGGCLVRKSEHLQAFADRFGEQCGVTELRVG